jgi:hypothetical protein
MANNLIALVDGETVELKGTALDELLAGQNSVNAKLEAEKAEAAIRATQRQAILDRLGLTEDEARLLLG